MIQPIHTVALHLNWSSLFFYSAKLLNIHWVKLFSSITSTIPYNNFQIMNDNDIITVILNGYDRFTENINVKFELV